VVEIIREFWKLTRRKHHFLAHHPGRVDFAVTLADVQVKHPENQGAFKAGAGAFQHIKTRARQFYASFKVNHPKPRTQIPMRLWFKIINWLLSNRADNNIILIIYADRDIRVRNIWQAGNGLMQFRFYDF